MSSPGDQRKKKPPAVRTSIDDYAYLDDKGNDISESYASSTPAERAAASRGRANDGVDTMAGPRPNPNRGRQDSDTPMTGTSPPPSSALVNQTNNLPPIYFIDDAFGIRSYQDIDLMPIIRPVTAAEIARATRNPTQEARPGDRSSGSGPGSRIRDPNYPQGSMQAPPPPPQGPPQQLSFAPSGGMAPPPASGASGQRGGGGGMGATGFQTGNSSSGSAPPAGPRGLPPPNIPRTPFEVPRDARGRRNRLLVNLDPTMWWNEPGQERTDPNTECCRECRDKKKSCNIGDRGFPCTRCESKGEGELCRNGSPNVTREKELIALIYGRGAADEGGENGGGGSDKGKGVDKGKGRAPREEQGSGGGDGRRRPGRDDRPERPRSASPVRDSGNRGGGSGIGGGRGGFGPYAGADDGNYPNGPGPPPLNDLGILGMSAQGGSGKSGFQPGLPQSSRPAIGNAKRPRPRNASPARDEADDDDDDDNGGEGSSRNPRPAKRNKRGDKSSRKKVDAKRVPIVTKLTNEEYLLRWGQPKKCYDCTTRRVSCKGRPCRRCINAGRVCVDWDLIPYAADGPLAHGADDMDGADNVNDVDDEDDDEESEDDGDDEDGDGVVNPATGSAARTRSSFTSRPARRAVDPAPRQPQSAAAAAASGRPQAPRRQRRRQPGEANPLDLFKGRANPYHHLRRDMEDEGFGVPTAERGGAGLAAPIPPWWHNSRAERMIDAQTTIFQRNAMALSDIRPCLGFGGTPESANRPVWEADMARAGWFIAPEIGNDSPPIPETVRPDPLPYNADEDLEPLPQFGRNMIDNDNILNARVPAPAPGYQIPWIATWHYDRERIRGQGIRANTETRGPLGWPYPMIESLTPQHGRNDPISDQVPCCEFSNYFKQPQDRVGVPCDVVPSLQCEVLPNSDMDHQKVPWHICHECRNKQANVYYLTQQETLRQQKLYLCRECALGVRAEGRSWPGDCLCYASKVCTNICHMHRGIIEGQAAEPILLAEEFLIRQGVLGELVDKCINCNERDADVTTDVWSCKICREWVQDTVKLAYDGSGPTGLMRLMEDGSLGPDR